VGRGIARMGPEDLEKLGIAVGDTVEITGKRAAVCKAMPAHKELRGQSRIQIDGLVRENAGAGLDEFVSVHKIVCRPAERVVLAPANVRPRTATWTISAACWMACRYAKAPASVPVVRQPLGGLPRGQHHAQGSGADQSHHDIGDWQSAAGRGSGRALHHVRGHRRLKPQLQRIREMIELPLRYPEVFEQLGSTPPGRVAVWSSGMRKDPDRARHRA